MPKLETGAWVKGEIVFAKQHKGDKGGVNVYYVKAIEEKEKKDGEAYTRQHSFLVKAFFLKAKTPKLLEVGTVARFDGILKTESYQDPETQDWKETTFIELEKVTL